MKKYSNILADERPEYKAANFGFDSLSNTELLSMVINRGAGTTESLSQARQLMNIADGSLSNLAKLSIDEMQVVQGIGDCKALAVLAAIELGKRRRAHADEARPRQQSSHLQLSHAADGRPKGRAGTCAADESELPTYQACEDKRGRNHGDSGRYSYHHAGGSEVWCNHHGTSTQSPEQQRHTEQSR